MSNFKAIIDELAACDLKNCKHVGELLYGLHQFIKMNALNEQEKAEALAVLEQLARKLEATGLKPSPSCCDYWDPIEKLIVERQSDIDYTGEIVTPEYPFSFLYAVYGTLLMDCHQDTKAMEVLDKGLEWNPVNTYMLQLCAIAAMRLNDMDALYDAAMDELTFSYTLENAALAYWHLGSYYFVRNDFKAAYCCFYMCRAYNPVEWKMKGNDKVFDILRPYCPEFEKLRTDDAMEVFADREIPFNRIFDMADLLADVGTKMAEEGSLDLAWHYLSHSYDINHNEAVGQLLLKIQSGAEKMS